MPLIVGGGVAVAGVISNYFKNRSANKSEKEKREMWNKYLADRQRIGGDIMDRLVAGGYDPFGPQTQTGTQSSNTSTSFNQTTTPTLRAEYQPMVGLSRGILEKRLASGSGLPAGYVEQGTQAINASTEGALNNLRNMARRRGVNAADLMVGSPVERDRRRQIAQLQVEAPLKSRELQNQDIGLSQSLAEAFGKGSRTSGSSNSMTAGTTSLTTPPNIANLMALLMPPAPGAGMETGISPAGGVAGDLGTGLMMMYNMGAFGKPATPGTYPYSG